MARKPSSKSSRPSPQLRSSGTATKPGKVVEIGQHEDLMNNKNLYYNLYKIKMQDPVTLGEK